MRIISSLRRIVKTGLKTGFGPSLSCSVFRGVRPQAPGPFIPQLFRQAPSPSDSVGTENNSHCGADFKLSNRDLPTLMQRTFRCGIWGCAAAQPNRCLVGRSCCSAPYITPSFRRRTSWLFAEIAFLLTWFALSAFAQQIPRIGYVFPAGGKAGSTFEAVAGGTLLANATNVNFSGEGVHATVVDFNKPMNQGAFNLLRDEARMLQDKQAAWNKALRAGQSAQLDSTNQWTAVDEKRLVELREKMLKNPPNRNLAPAIAEVVTLRIEIDANAAPGVREFRLGSANALSNPLKFHVGQLPEFSKSPAATPNPEAERLRERLGGPALARKAETEIRINLPTVLNGQIMPGVIDRYRFRVRKGQRLVMAAQARELIPYIADAVPGWFQAALTLYDSKGREIAYSDDFRLHPDPVILCEIPSDGEYVLEVKDAIYRGREDFVYRISVGELRYVTEAFPLGCAAGNTAEIELSGWNLKTNRMTFDARRRLPGIYEIPAAADSLSVNRKLFAVDDLPELTESETNHSDGQALELQLPVNMNGRISKAGQEDCFRFKGMAGQSIVAEVTARRLGSPLDSALTLIGPNGNRIASNDDHEDKGAGLETHHADARLAVVLPADADYVLRLSDSQGKGSSAHAYRLRVSAPRPDFDLRLTPSALNLRNGASAVVTVHALRRDGFTNEIALALKNAPPGFALSGAKIPAGQEQVKLTVKAPMMPADDWFPLELEGRAKIAGHTVVRSVVPADDLMQAFFYRHLVPAQQWLVAVAGRLGQRDAFKILSPLPVRIAAGLPTRVEVGFPRGPLSDRIQIELSDAPSGVKLKNVALTKTGAELFIECEASTAVPGQGGNLIFTASYQRNNDSARKGLRPGRQSATLPAIPFEFSAAGPVADPVKAE